MAAEVEGDEGEQEPCWMELLREEAIAVATVMRQNTRFALTSRKGEHELLKGVTDILRRTGLEEEDAVAPFIAVMVSSETTGSMTGAALASTTRLVDSRAISSPVALQQLLQAVVTCQFEETDRSDDELVIMQMLEAVTAIVTSPRGTSLGSERLVHTVETLLRLLAESRCSSLLRHSAFASLGKILRRIFTDLEKYVDDVQDQGSNRHATDGCLPSQCGEVKHDDSGAKRPLSSGVADASALEADTAPDGCHAKSSDAAEERASVPQQKEEEGSEQQVREEGAERDAVDTKVENHSHIQAAKPQGDATPGNNTATTDGTFDACFRREHAFAVLATVIDALANVQEGPGLESLPCTLLTLLSVCVSAARVALRNPPGNFRDLVNVRMMSVIAVNAMTDDPERLAAALSLSRKIFFHLRGGTAGSLQVLLSRIALVIGEERRSSSALKGVILDALGELCVMPGLLQELYINYDCNLPSPNLFQKIILFLSKSALPISPPLSSHNTRALEALRRALQTLSEDGGHVAAKPCGSASQLSVQKLTKRRLETAADHFNRSPNKGIAYLQSVGLVSEPATPAELAWFLSQAEGLDKIAVGDYLGERDELNLEVLKAFAEGMDFSDMQIDDALRYFLSTFRLPGESQKIDRITEAFAVRYYQQQSSLQDCVFHSSDAVHILTFSVIMLNTDLHNPQNKKRMTLEEFVRNNRGINENKATKKSEDLPRELLTAIYSNIQTNEIKLNETVQTSGAKGSRTAESWEKEMFAAGKEHKDYITWDMARGLEGEMFAGVWGPVLAGALAAAESAWTFQQLELPMQTLDSAAALASKHGLSAPLDHLLSHLVSLTTIPSTTPSSLHTLAETLGSSPKAQSSLVALSKIAREYGDAVREGWSAVVTVVIILHTAGLVTLHPEAPGPSPVPARKSVGGDWQWLAGWGDGGRNNDGERSAEAEGKKLVHDCKIANVLQEDTQYLSPDALYSLVHALASCEASETHATLPLLMLSSISVANRDRVEAVWGILVERVEVAVSDGRTWDGPVASSVEAVASLALRAVLVPLIASEVPRMLTMLCKIQDTFLETVAASLSQHVHDLLAQEGHALASVGGIVNAVCLLEKIGTRFSVASGFAVEGVGLVGLGSVPLAEAEWKQCVSTLSALAFSNAAIEAQCSLRALDYVFAMQKGGVEQGGESKWLQVLGAVSSACLAPTTSLRDYAFLSLERLMLVPAPPPGPPDGPDIGEGQQTCPGAAAWQAAFDEVMFKVLEGLMDEKRVESWQPVGLDKSRLRAWLLVCKVLLHQLQMLSRFPYFSTLWLSFLEHTERYMLHKHATQLHQECVPQQLHNLIEVMQLHGIFSKEEGSELDGNALWNQTWTTVHRFCPDLRPPEAEAKDESEEKEVADSKDAQLGDGKDAVGVVENTPATITPVVRYESSEPVAAVDGAVDQEHHVANAVQ